VAPVGEKEEYIARAWRNISPYLPADLASDAVPGADGTSREHEMV